MSESDDKEKPASKFNIQFGSGVSIGHQQIGDVHTNTYNENVHMSVITVDNKLLESMPKEYAESLQAFTTLLNSQLQKENIQSAKTAPIQSKINELAEETARLKETAITQKRKSGIRERLKGVAKAIVKASPKIAKTIVNFTPLAPFSELIGETFKNLIENEMKP